MYRNNTINMDSNHLWKILMGMTLSLLVVGARVDINPIMRTSISECPQNAVCANIFRTSQSDNPYKDRIIINCRCPVEDGMTESEDSVGGGCPYRAPNANNSVYQSQRHREVLCRQDLRECVGNEIARERNSDINGRLYFAVYCRCPYHQRPNELENRMKATVPHYLFTTRYVCNRS
ncbi:uncharacterized protein LOC117342247 isoform X2 [Pecten maximus]|uniref:uncharacterized protein LOC117342247 isoform X2 n=1 Tax=Pecten maximus TaxID=6579 RepID=UPI00145897DA|nr:uncharacterized protein LOC117342247 isoform X2 [Pecten maximus]